MPYLPIIKPKKLIQILHKIGFIETRQSGSHKNKIVLSPDEFIKELHK